MGCTLAFLQKTPKMKPICVGIFTVGEDNRVWVRTKQSYVPYKATIVSTSGDVIMSNCEAFLKELERQPKISQITYVYTQNEDLSAEYLDQLTSEQ